MSLTLPCEAQASTPAEMMSAISSPSLVPPTENTTFTSAADYPFSSPAVKGSAQALPRRLSPIAVQELPSIASAPSHTYLLGPFMFARGRRWTDLKCLDMPYPSAGPRSRVLNFADSASLACSCECLVSVSFLGWSCSIEGPGSAALLSSGSHRLRGGKKVGVATAQGPSGTPKLPPVRH
jgi:hypothetical protein